MLLGRFADAWRESDAIAARTPADPNRLWDGRPFTGRRVMIRCLHGYGDAIQFLRYASLVRRHAARIIVQTHPELVALLGGIDAVDCVTTWSDGCGQRSVDWDQQIEVMELPRIFRTTIRTIPSGVPYLAVAGQYQEQRRRLLGSKCNPRVGLMWAGGGWDPARNATIDDLLPILATPGVEFYSFQRGPDRERLQAIHSRSVIRDLSGDTPDVAYFAADLLQMDLLITVDTMAAHLAGALAKPVWLLLPFRADWRWMLHRQTSPWYPTMRLFRQRVPGDWNFPIRQISLALPCFVAGLVASKRSAGPLGGSFH